MSDKNDDGTFQVPIQPTGSGVADLEIAREQAALVEADAVLDPTQPPMDDAAGGPQAKESDAAVGSEDDAAGRDR